jgi:hypothetical protein
LGGGGAGRRADHFLLMQTKGPEIKSVGKVSQLHMLTCIGASQIIACIQFLDDVLMDLVPFTLCVTPMETSLS